MDREPQDSKHRESPGKGAQGTPPLRELTSASSQTDLGSSGPWSAFMARILRPAPTESSQSEP